MKKVLFILICFMGLLCRSQKTESTTISSSSLFKDLSTGDSVTFYQCHVEEAIQQLATASGQTLTGKQQKYSITEKYVLIKEENGYKVSYYTSSLNVFPNKKFSGLKIRERPYWGFQKDKTFQLKENDLKVFLAMERKGREAIEYDYAITRYTTNQVIIKKKKDFKQLVIDGNYVISKLITLD